jgi:hypothetical protein
MMKLINKVPAPNMYKQEEDMFQNRLTVVMIFSFFLSISATKPYTNACLVGFGQGLSDGNRGLPGNVYLLSEVAALPMHYRLFS